MNIRNSLTLTLALGVLALTPAAFAARDQGSAALVTVAANGTDVRTVLHDLFGQTKQNYVIEPSVRYALYLSLDKVDFDEALAIVCHLAKLKAEKQNGIYYVSEDKALESPITTDAPGGIKPKDSPRHIEMLQGTAETPGVTATILRVKRVTTRLAKTDIRKVFATISRETGVPIVVDSSVPQCKLDAFLEKTSLKYALDQITGAAKLRYRIVEKHSIFVYSDQTENRVAVSGD
jgi:type II secretory pathway component GspD/PulD (secretin)